jgi:hypothetical protein
MRVLCSKNSPFSTCAVMYILTLQVNKFKFQELCIAYMSCTFNINTVYKLNGLTIYERYILSGRIVFILNSISLAINLRCSLLLSVLTGLLLSTMWFSSGLFNTGPFSTGLFSLSLLLMVITIP